MNGAFMKEDKVLYDNDDLLIDYRPETVVKDDRPKFKPKSRRERITANKRLKSIIRSGVRKW